MSNEEQDVERADLLIKNQLLFADQQTESARRTVVLVTRVRNFQPRCQIKVGSISSPHLPATRH